MFFRQRAFDLAVPCKKKNCTCLLKVFQYYYCPMLSRVLAIRSERFSSFPFYRILFPKHWQELRSGVLATNVLPNKIPIAKTIVVCCSVRKETCK